MAEFLPARWSCALLTSLAAVLLALRLRPARARVAWSVLLLAALANALWLSLQPQNLVNINVVHHYLGAKYSFRYDALYRLVNGAAGRPQVAMRDLERPPARVRDDPRAQRAYYIDLLRGAGVTFDPLVPTAELRARAETSGVLGAEADSILRAELPADQVAPFRRDVQLALLVRRAEANIEVEGRDITQDYGFNGSPFWCLLRRIDPTVHRPFGTGTARLNLAWQTVAALASCWILGAALGAGLTTRIAMAALLFASWDFVGWALPGLIFAEYWLPTVLALFAWRMRRHALAGAAVAWAGLIKLFPFVLLAPLVAHAGFWRLRWRRRSAATASQHAPSGHNAFRMLLVCCLATLALALVSLPVGRAWDDFLRKILVQFQSDAFLANSVGLSQAFVALGVQGSFVPRLLSLATLLPILAMFRPGQEEGFETSLPRRALLLLAALGWVVHTWFNYYTVATVLALPILALGHPRGAGVAAVAMAVAVALPEFDDPARVSQPTHIFKLAPYLLVPAGLVVAELRRGGWSRRTHRLALVGLAIWVAVAGAEIARWRRVRTLEKAAAAALDRGDAGAALRDYRRALRLDPRDVPSRLNEAIALWMLGDTAQAGTVFAHAVALAPANVAARKDYGRWLLLANRIDAAERELQFARDLAPYDDRVLFDLARARRARGRPEEALQFLHRARELDPGNRDVLGLLAELGARTTP